MWRAAVEPPAQLLNIMTSRGVWSAIPQLKPVEGAFTEPTHSPGAPVDMVHCASAQSICHASIRPFPTVHHVTRRSPLAAPAPAHDHAKHLNTAATQIASQHSDRAWRAIARIELQTAGTDSPYQVEHRATLDVVVLRHLVVVHLLARKDQPARAGSCVTAARGVQHGQPATWSADWPPDVPSSARSSFAAMRPHLTQSEVAGAALLHVRSPASIQLEPGMALQLHKSIVAHGCWMGAAQSAEMAPARACDGVISNLLLA